MGPSPSKGSIGRTKSYVKDDYWVFTGIVNDPFKKEDEFLVADSPKKRSRDANMDVLLIKSNTYRSSTPNKQTASQIISMAQSLRGKSQKRMKNMLEFLNPKKTMSKRQRHQNHL